MHGRLRHNDLGLWEWHGNDGLIIRDGFVSWNKLGPKPASVNDYDNDDPNNCPTFTLILNDDWKDWFEDLRYAGARPKKKGPTQKVIKQRLSKHVQHVEYDTAATPHCANDNDGGDDNPSKCIFNDVDDEISSTMRESLADTDVLLSSAPHSIAASSDSESSLDKSVDSHDA